MKRNKKCPNIPPLTRSEIMARVHSKNTFPETFVRSSLHKAGLRFRIHRKNLPGTPDIVFPSRRVALFVNGCFWHFHEGCKQARIPLTRREFWEEKLMRNVERDKANYAALEAAGWRVIVIWECEISANKINDLVFDITQSHLSEK
ncbi:MAG: very short patch repair endonuclease [Desulfobacteraceae bacterium]|nr:very short patch repair endonuclease [Desulfobacteraceae bacterium]